MQTPSRPVPDKRATIFLFILVFPLLNVRLRAQNDSPQPSAAGQGQTTAGLSEPSTQKRKPAKATYTTTSTERGTFTGTEGGNVSPGTDGDSSSNSVGPTVQPSYIQRLLRWVSGSAAAATSFALNVISFLLAVAGFGLYIGQKREYRLLFGMLQEYQLKERIAASAKDAEEQKKVAEEQLQEAQKAIQDAKRDLAERLPLEARRIYFENTIPVVQKQILDLSVQLEQMSTDYSSLGGGTTTMAPQLARVLTEEVRRHVSLRRRMEQSEGFLAILTGTTASIGIIAPYPYSFAAVPFAALALAEAVRFFRLWRLYYRASRPNNAA